MFVSEAQYITSHNLCSGTWQQKAGVNALLQPRHSRKADREPGSRAEEGAHGLVGLLELLDIVRRRGVADVR